MLIGISGQLKAGKDLAGEILTEYSKNPVEIKKFAEKLKQIICLLINCQREDLEDQNFKNKILEDNWWYYKCLTKANITTLKNYNNYKENIKVLEKENIKVELIKTTPRLLLQLLGSECGRDILHPNIWINSLFSGYNTSKNWIITDARFLNELEVIKEYKGITIKVERYYKDKFPELFKEMCKEFSCSEEDFLPFLLWKDTKESLALYKNLTHQSEVDVNKFKNFDYTITAEQNRTMESFREALLKIFNKIK